MSKDKNNPSISAETFKALMTYAYDKVGLSGGVEISTVTDKSDHKNYIFTCSFITYDEEITAYEETYSFPKSVTLGTLCDGIALAIKKYINSKNGVKVSSKKINLRKDDLRKIN